jgi:hypothetical protein
MGLGSVRWRGVGIHAGNTNTVRYRFRAPLRDAQHRHGVSPSWISGYARAHVGRLPLLVLLLTSYLISAMEAPICDLEVVLHPSFADPDMLELAKSYCERYSKPHLSEKKKSPLAASNASR